MNRTASIVAVLAAVIILTSPAASAATPQATDLTPQFVNAGLAIDKLQAFEIGGIVVLRGRTGDKLAAEEAGRLAQTLGHLRVANLIQVVAEPDDRAIERIAERELTIHRTLDGTRFSVESDGGVLRITGQVRHELQKDVAIQLLRGIDGVKEVRSQLTRF
jgi:osmotically-inducible protein OsmY